MKIRSIEIKNYAKNIGADLTGIASIDRFKNAPKGHHPKDILESCKSVIVCAKKMPEYNQEIATWICDGDLLELQESLYCLILYHTHLPNLVGLIYFIFIIS